MDLNQAILLLWYGSILLLAVLWLRLWVTGLWRVDIAFAAYIAALLVESVGLLLLIHNQKLYGKVWAFSRGAVLLVQLNAIMAMFGRWTANFPGTAAFGKRLAGALLAISIAISVSSFSIPWEQSGWDVASQFTALVNRGIDVGCAVFLVLMLGFFLKFGGPVPSNLKRHTWSMAAYVGANAVGYFLMSRHGFNVANIFLPSISLAALAFWIVAIKPSGELQPVTAYNEEEWEAAEQMNAQLQKLADAVTLSPHGLRKKK